MKYILGTNEHFTISKNNTELNVDEILGNVVSTESNQGLTETAKNNARLNIGAINSDFLTTKDAFVIKNTDTFLRRITGGIDADRISDGYAYITSIKGNTVAWNQLAPRNTFTNSRVDTRKYFNFQIQAYYKNNYVTGIFSSSASAGQTIRQILTVPSTANQLRVKHSGSRMDIVIIAPDELSVIPTHVICFTLHCVSADPTTEGGLSLSNIGIYDLTLIYGAGNEPTTPEQFEADYLGWFGKPLSYEPYDAGSLRPVLMDGIKTIFNQWDEEWVNGYVDSVTGNVIENSSTTIASENLIPVVSNATYYFKGNGYITLYDANQVVIGQVLKNNGTFDTGTNVRYIRFHIDNYGRTYSHNICINISNQDKNGTYEPYEEDLTSIPITNMKGRQINNNGNFVSNSILVFPDGLKKVDDVYDEIYVENGVTKAIKRVGSVNLGTLDWEYSNSYFMSSTIFGIRFETLKAICPKYNNFQYDSSRFISIGDNFAVIKDSAYTNAATLKASLNGVMLYYELDIPLKYEIDWNPLCHTRYLVEKGETEELRSYNNSSNPTLTIEYGYNFDYLQTPIIRSGSLVNTLLVESSNLVGYDTITLNAPFIRSGQKCGTLLVESSNAIGYDRITLVSPYIIRGSHSRDILVESSNDMGYSIVSLPEVPSNDSGLLKREDYNTFKDSIHFEENIKNNSDYLIDYPGFFIESSIRQYYVNAEILSVKSASVGQTRPFMGTTSYLSDVADLLEIIFPDRAPNSELISTFTCIFKTGTNCNITLTSNYSIRLLNTSFSFSDNCIYELNARYIDSNIGWLVAIGKWS